MPSTSFAPLRWWRAWRHRRRWWRGRWWPPSRRATVLGLVVGCAGAAVLGTWLGSATPVPPRGMVALPAGTPYQAHKPRTAGNDLVDLGGSPAAFRRDGVLAHVTSDRRAVELTDPDGDEQVGSFPLPGTVADLAPDPDERTADVTDPDGTLRVLDLDAGRVTRSVSVGGRPGAVAVAPDGRRVYVGDAATGSVAVVDQVASRVVARWTVPHAVSDLAVGADGTRLVVAHRDAGTVTLLDTGSGEAVGTAPVPSGPFYAEAGPTAVAAGRTSAYVAGGGGVTVVDLRTAAWSRPDWAADPVIALTLSPDGRRLYLVTYVTDPRAGTDATPLTTVDPVDRRVLVRTELDVEQVGAPVALTLSPDGHRLLLNSVMGVGQTQMLDLR